MRVKITDKFNSFYFIGIGGVSMSGLAKYLLSIGKTVGGSDEVENDYTKRLTEMGAKIDYSKTEYGVENYDLVIYTDAIHENDLRLNYAKSLKKEVMPRGKFLREISRNFKTVIAVAGCHGKTTCTAMLAHIFSAAGKKYAAHIGGNDVKFGNFVYCGEDYFITEACEYKKNFLLIKPDIAVILNSDADHLECYNGIEDLKNSYKTFGESATCAITLYCDLPISAFCDFGFDKSACYYAENIKTYNGQITFNVVERGVPLGNIKLNAYGKHNVLNSLAAVAAARAADIDFCQIKEGLESFCGVERRFENIGKVNGADCIADYAHHPNELRAVIRTAKKFTSGKLYVIFQPHTYSRTKNLFGEFVKVLSPLNNLMIFKTYAAREYYDDSGSALTLSAALKKSCYADSIYDVVNFMRQARYGDTVLILGAGDIYFTAKRALVFLNDIT